MTETRKMPKHPRSGGAALALVCAVVFALAGCQDAEVVGEYPNPRKGDSTPYDYQKSDGGLFGPSGISFGTGSDKNKNEDGTGSGGLSVNSFLWRASLDTLSFMPISSADPFGGVIITDWHAMTEVPNERFKMNVYILGRSLRADGVRVAVFRQVADSRGGWQDAAVDADTAPRIEDAILTRARQLRYATLATN
jgi:Domain of unknown function (DUF3576)